MIYLVMHTSRYIYLDSSLVLRSPLEAMELQLFLQHVCCEKSCEGRPGYIQGYLDSICREKESHLKPQYITNSLAN